MQEIKPSDTKELDLGAKSEVRSRMISVPRLKYKIVNTTREQLSCPQSQPKVLWSSCKSSNTGLRVSHLVIIKLEVFKS